MQVNCDTLSEIQLTFKHICLLSMTREQSEKTEESLKYLQQLVSSVKQYPHEELKTTDKDNEKELDPASENNINELALYKRTPYGRIFNGKNFYSFTYIL